MIHSSAEPDEIQSCLLWTLELVDESLKRSLEDSCVVSERIDRSPTLGKGYTVMMVWKMWPEMVCSGLHNSDVRVSWIVDEGFPHRILRIVG